MNREAYCLGFPSIKKCFWLGLLTQFVQRSTIQPGIPPRRMLPKVVEFTDFSNTMFQ